jgi:hypothetical protein
LYLLQNRVKVFMEFLEQNRLDKVSVDADQSEQLIRLLDAVVIRLEGGTDYDLLALDEPRPTTSGSGQGSAGPGSNQTSKAGAVTAGQVTEKQGSGDADVKAGSVKEEEEEQSKPFILGEE